MINTLRECRETSRMLEARAREGHEQYRTAMEEIRTLRRGGEITNNFSLRTLFEETVLDGREAVHEMQDRRQRGVNLLMEAAGDSINTANFSNIIGQIAYADVLDNFESPEFIGDQLVTQIPATTGQKEIVPGITMIGDQAAKVAEGHVYPVVGIGEQFIVYPEIYKDGFVMNITEEAIFEDKTGRLLENFNKVAESMAINLEKERLSTVLGVTNTYSRNGGPEQNTYGNTHTQGDFDNLFASNPLTDYAALEAAMIGFAAVTDPETGEPIVLGQDLILLVPTEKIVKAGRVLNAIQVRTTASSVETITGNPLAYMGSVGTPRPLSNQYVGSVASSTTTWWLGNFKGAFVERVIIPTQVETQDRTSDMSFERDVVSRIRVKRRSAMGVKEPRKVQKHTD